MSKRAEIVARPAWRARVAGSAPRLVFAVALAILVVLGLRSLTKGPDRVMQVQPTRSAASLAVEAFAERFTRAFLTWDPSHPERHDQQVGAFTAGTLEAGAGLQVPAHAAQKVVWTAAIHDEAVSQRLRLVTVAAETSSSPYYVSVPVQRDRRGFMAVSRYPALVGAPPVATNAGSFDEPAVEDTRLKAVVRRTLTNYLGREAANLRADLDASAVVALPATGLEVKSISSLTWVGRGRVAAELRAQGRGTVWTLGYRVAVVKRDRWYVRSIESDPSRLR
jgi:hypothetical protein